MVRDFKVRREPLSTELIGAISGVVSVEGLGLRSYLARGMKTACTFTISKELQARLRHARWVAPDGRTLPNMRINCSSHGMRNLRQVWRRHSIRTCNPDPDKTKNVQSGQVKTQCFGCAIKHAPDFWFCFSPPANAALGSVYNGTIHQGTRERRCCRAGERCAGAPSPASRRELTLY